MADAVTFTIATPCVATQTAHGLATGDMYAIDGGTLPTGLIDGGSYYARVIDANTFYLAGSKASAELGTTGLAVTFSSATDIFTLAAHGLSIGMGVMLTAASMPSGFSAGTMYYVASTNFTSGQFQLAATVTGAAINASTNGTSVVASTLVNTSGSQSGTHYGAKPSGETDGRPEGIAVTFDNTTDIFSATAHGLPVGSAVVLSAASMPSGFTAGTVYYIIAANYTANQFQIATAVGGSAVLGTSNGTSVVASSVNRIYVGNQAITLSNVPVAVPVKLTNIVTGSRVRVSLASDNSEIYLGTESANQVSFSTKTSGNVYVDVRKKGYIPYRQAAVIDGAAGLTSYVSQVADTVVV